jgi:transcriptional regulator with XRE-family HTH domain
MNRTSNRPTLRDLGRRLKRARQELNRTQREFATDSNYQQAQIARAEGGADIRVSTLIELARALGLELMLVPRSLTPTIDALIQSDSPTEERPLYTLEKDE